MIERFEQLLNAEQCERIIRLARPHLLEKFRTSVQPGRGGCKFRLEELQRFAARKANVPLDQVEVAEVVCYNPGVEYVWHYDCAWRTHTLLVYLNDDYQGGETEFRDHGIIQPKQGDAILWRNSLDRLQGMQHRVRNIERGQKWVAVIWVWDQRVDPQLLSGKPPIE